MKVAILGMGAYGIALSKIFYKNENDVSIWTKFRDELDSVKLKRENSAVLPGVKIPKEIELTCDMTKCINKADIIVVAIPMNALREVLKELNEVVQKEQVICMVTKGIESQTGKFVFDIASEELENKNICMLSGPSIANEIASSSVVGMSVASLSNYSNLTLKVCLENNEFIISTTDDVVGVQVASSIKNVFAILCGYMNGRKFPDSLKAAVLSKLIADMRSLIVYFGGKEETLFSYAGLGDMLLTCMSNKSRNYTFGTLIGEGATPNVALKNMQVKTVEGLATLEILYKVLQEKNVKIKSIETLYNIVYKGIKVENILKNI